MIHFGLSRRAQGFRIERSAHNRLSVRADARGALPESRVILADGPDRHDTALPASALAAHLRTRGFPAATSRSAGGYLCNYLYYRSLDWATGQESPSVIVFVHMPPGPSHGGPLSEERLLHAAQETLRFVLAYAMRQAGQDPLVPRVGSARFASPLEGEADRSRTQAPKSKGAR
jgi:pyroglutamyl-peptidase